MNAWKDRLKHARAALLVLAAAGFGCAGESKFATGFAPNFDPAHHAVSILGVYKDGRMSSDAWGAFGPQVERSLGGSPCEIGFDSSLAMTNAPLSAAIDDYARSNGPTNDLLTELAPAARGDLIMVLTSAGQPPTAAPKTSVADVPATAGGMGGRGFATVSTKPKGTADTNLLQLSALFYSVAQGRPVARIDLQYSGASADDAVKEFAAKLLRALPGSTCSGWNWDAKLDPERIRRLDQ